MATPEEGRERQQREEAVFVIQNTLRTLLPEYNLVDSSGFYTYNKKEDIYDRGNLLPAYTEKGQTDQDPHLLFIFRGEHFTLNYYHTPEPEKPYHIRNPNNSLYGKRQQSWQLDELDFAIERAKIHMEGVNVDDPSFRDQLAGWSEREQRFITMGELVARTVVYKDAKKSKKAAVKQELELDKLQTVWNLYDTNPQKASELALERIHRESEYTTLDGGKTTADEIIRQIGENTVSGRKALFRELYKIESYERLLKDHGVLLR